MEKEKQTAKQEPQISVENVSKKQTAERLKLYAQKLSEKKK